MAENDFTIRSESASYEQGPWYNEGECEYSVFRMNNDEDPLDAADYQAIEALDGGQSLVLFQGLAGWWRFTRLPIQA